MSEHLYSELVDNQYGLTLRVKRVLLDEMTPYQRLEIFENEALGRVMTLDGCMMLTDAHEFTYHELLVHPALLAHPEPKRVLVIGGGDGGTLREVVKHPSVEEAVLCEIDQAVIDASRLYFPETAKGLDHPKSTLYVGDGIEYIRKYKNSFDVVIVDSTDPVGFAEGLFRQPFYADVKGALRGQGIFVQQSESPFFVPEPWKKISSELRASFKNVNIYGGAIPMYPSGYWTFAISSDELDPWTHFDPKRAAALPDLKYYTPEHQRAAFVLPAFARKLLEG